MSSTYLAIFNVIAAAAFLVMWQDDRQRKHLLCWAVAHALIPVVLLSAFAVDASPQPATGLYAVLYALSVSCVSIGMVAGAMYYRGIQIAGLRIVIAISTATLLLFMLSFSATGIAMMLGTGFIALSYAAVARLLWTHVIVERVVAVFFALRATLVLVLFSLHGAPNYTEVLSLASALSANLNAVLLLIISFFQTTANLNRNLLLANALHTITAKSRTIGSGHQMGRLALEELLRLPLWRAGALMKVSDDRKYLELIAEQGFEAEIKSRVENNRVPIAGSLSEPVINTGKAKVWLQADAKALSFSNVYKRLFRSRALQRGINIIVPVSNQGETIGVLVVSDDLTRSAYPQELETLTSVGEVIGSAIENLAYIRSLNFRANHDTLTGLSNRTSLHEFCQNQLGGNQFTLMLFDLNNFKEVNDVFGHAVGDSLLKTLAAFLKRELADEAALFRLGGDEFVVVYPKDNRHSTESLAEGLLTLIKQPLVIDGMTFECVASIGVVDTDVVGNNSHELLRCADLAMYKAKHGDLKIAYYDKPYDKYVRERIELLADVNQGLARHEFELFYQPIVDTKNSACTLCEALLRWHHPSKGLLSAAEFIPVVEQTEQITALTYRVIELALRDLATWLEQGIDLSVAINLSARNFLDAKLPDFLLNVCIDHGVPPQCLQLEITETVLMKDPHIAEQITRRLTDLGFRISLDDFGTGHSSLAYLARFPISTVKIDRNFISRIIDDERSKNIVEATIGLTHKLGYLATAEGVEDAAVEQVLKEAQCDQVQGYYYAKPAPKTVFDVWYHANAKAPAVTPKS